MKILSTLLLVPLDDNVVFPNMNVTISADVGDEDRVLLVPRHDGEYAKVGTVAEVADRLRLPGGIGAVNLVGLHRGVAGAAHTDAQGRLRVEVQERPDEEPPGVKTRELEREYRAVVEEILELRGDDGRISSFVRSIGELGTLADTAAYAPEITLEERLDPVYAREVLDTDHAVLEDVKERIVEYLAVRKLRQERGIAEDKRSGAILTLIGPPGTGKTSIGESIARALNREFVRMSLG